MKKSKILSTNSNYTNSRKYHNISEALKDLSGPDIVMQRIAQARMDGQKLAIKIKKEGIQ